MTAAPPPISLPIGHPLLGVLPDYTREKQGFLLRCAQKYGDVVPLRFGPIHYAYLVSHPDAIERVLVKDHRNFTKGQALRRSRPLFGNGLLTSEGDFWRRQRKLAQPAFHRERIASYGEIMVDLAREQRARWQSGEIRDMHAEMLQLTLKIAAKTLFGTEISEGERIGQALDTAQEDFAKYIPYVVLLPRWCPTPLTPRTARAIRTLDRVVYGIIRERRASGEDRGDLLSMLLRAQDEDDGTVMNDKQIRDEVLTLFLAGHETTALTLTWALYLIAQHPEIIARLHAELDGVLNPVVGDQEAIGIDSIPRHQARRLPTMNDLPRLIYTEQIIREAMRLYPPAWAIGRCAIADYEIDGVKIPAGSTAIMSQWVVHRDSRWFPDPDQFKPGRWTADFTSALPRFAYFPFGGGPRICIGSSFAMMEAVLLLATLAQTYRFDLVPDQRVELQAAVTLRPLHGIRMTLSRR